MATWLGLVLATVLLLQQAKGRWGTGSHSVPRGESPCGWGTEYWGGKEDLPLQ